MNFRLIAIIYFKKTLQWTVFIFSFQKWSRYLMTHFTQITLTLHMHTYIKQFFVCCLVCNGLFTSFMRSLFIWYKTFKKKVFAELLWKVTFKKTLYLGEATLWKYFILLSILLTKVIKATIIVSIFSVSSNYRCQLQVTTHLCTLIF